VKRRKASGHGAGKMTMDAPQMLKSWKFSMKNSFFMEKKIIIHNQWEIHDYKSWFIYVFMGFHWVYGDE
jgi:hypothetical protein